MLSLRLFDKKRLAEIEEEFELKPIAGYFVIHQNRITETEFILFEDGSIFHDRNANPAYKWANMALELLRMEARERHLQPHPHPECAPYTFEPDPYKTAELRYSPA